MKFIDEDDLLAGLFLKELYNLSLISAMWFGGSLRNGALKLEVLSSELNSINGFNFFSSFCRYSRRSRLTSSSSWTLRLAISMAFSFLLINSRFFLILFQNLTSRLIRPSFLL